MKFFLNDNQEINSKYAELSNCIFKRNFRWTLEGEGLLNGQPVKVINPTFVKACDRPVISMELFHSKFYTCLSYEITLYDVHHKDIIFIRENWRNFKDINIKLTLCDGTFTELEKWDIKANKFLELIPSKLDYADSEVATIKLVLEVDGIPTCTFSNML